MAGATAAIGLGTSVAKFFGGRKMEREAQKHIDNFRWQDLDNVMEDVQISTRGADLRREELGRSTATAIDALSKGGARTLAAGIGRVQENNTRVAREIGANLDEQQKQLDYAVAQDNARIQQMTERRQANELAGYGQMLNTGMGMKWGAMGDLLNTAGYISQTDFGKQIDGGIASLFGGGGDGAGA